MQKFSLNPPATLSHLPSPALSLDQASLFILRLLSLCLCTLLIPHSSGYSIFILHLLKFPSLFHGKTGPHTTSSSNHWIIMLGHRDRDYVSPHQHTYQELKHAVAMYCAARQARAWACRSLDSTLAPPYCPNNPAPQPVQVPILSSSPLPQSNLAFYLPLNLRWL